MADSKIEADKVQAYRSTHYRVGIGPLAFTLKIDQRSEALARLYMSTGEACGVFVTAWNPYGTLQSEELNKAAHARLSEHLREISSHVIEGAGGDPLAQWPEEKSFFALGIAREKARELGKQFRQDAVVWFGPEAIPRLLLLR